MKSIKLALIIIAFTLFVWACNTNSTPTTNTSVSNANSSTANANLAPTPAADEFASTRALYAQHCAPCHGEEANGGIVKVDNLKLKVPSLKEGHALKHTDEQFVKQITKGGDGMPAFRDKLKPEEINDLVRFIRQEFQKGAAPATGMNHNMTKS